MKIKELTLTQMENLEGGISDKLYWALICAGIGALYGAANLYLGIGVGLICSIYGPSLDTAPISDYRDPGDLRKLDSPSGSSLNLK